ncbi:50S ribosomal protein L11 methyltransferase [Exiguobacterium sp. A1_3_1]|jgi:ribosomal protein L11 methyltransferase|uniref:Ribosomal protein L11 methyltransferase n=4 Tax=Exiguobacterium TaxID=33986 RepID=A0A0V8GFS3_9BACL|nr:MULTISPECIES: 50S ribosomal protein L11 methyltransferase [Exiguobacterium]AOS99932.1 ribosomal protein L11 methyltransferase [Exiguobacterium sp. U13-1]KNH37739.1 ribosomal protein L11 methyltransferase [Exiguobacterium acetylicum]KSU49116.1 ribosomal protein L11 methyltransferase [Exiguobacterium enclense]KTR28619.1 ribosomal protein L11 methyltransferase [Exiguobacterium indicum]MBF8153682.1 50S ribosomal protein L11 methyltransferase [Exiguobacterium sp. TBG-PICH-001]
MKWSEICVHTTQEAIEAVSNILHEAGASGVVIEDVEDFEMMSHREDNFGEIWDETKRDEYPTQGVLVKAYLAESSDLTDTIKGIEHDIQQLTNFGLSIGTGAVTLTQVDEEDWAHSWKQFYKPVKISRHLTVVPMWEDYTPQPDEKIIELDPGMAFGTGTHPTTVLCIQAIENYLQEQDRVVDVGTGSGVLAIAAAKLGAKDVFALDLDEVAVKSATENVALNEVSEQITVRQGDLMKELSEPVELIVANILAEVILLFVKDAYTLTLPGGHFIASGIISQKKDMVVQAMQEAGFTIVETTKLEDWVAIIAKREA